MINNPSPKVKTAVPIPRRQLFWSRADSYRPSIKMCQITANAAIIIPASWTAGRCNRTIINAISEASVKAAEGEHWL
jgi:hypothetical protein